MRKQGGTQLKPESARPILMKVLAWPPILVRVWLIASLVALAISAAGCGDGDEWEPNDDGEVAGTMGVALGALTSGSLRSANGTYGSGCLGRAGSSWSLPIASGAVLQYSALTVAQNNAACVLTLTQLRSADPAGGSTAGLYTAGSGIALTTSYAGSTFSGTSGDFPALVRLSAVTYATSFTVDIVFGDWSVSAQTKGTSYLYNAEVAGDAPLSYWRFEETAASNFVYDDFSGATSASSVATHAGATGATWSKNTAATTSPGDAVYTAAGRVRASATKKTVYTASGTPPSTDYSVAADLYMASLLNYDSAGVIARASTSASTYYFGGYNTTYAFNGFCCYTLTQYWEIWKVVAGSKSQLFSTSVSLSAGSTYRVVLTVSGTTSTSVRLSINGSEVASVTDASSPITTVGSAGLLVGQDSTDVAQTDTKGGHLDNFAAQRLVQAADSRPAANHGLHVGGPTLGATGALGTINGTLISNKAITFNGSNYVEVNRQIGDDFSIELWFKSTSSAAASSGTNWYDGDGLVDAYTSAGGSDFGIALRSDGKLMAGTGALVFSYCNFYFHQCPDDTTLITNATYKDGAWHHVVFTRQKSSSALALYVDGTLQKSGTASSTSTLNASSAIDIGRLADGSRYFTGLVDEVAVYTTVLSATVVSRHYQSGLL
ncbi:MAG: Laminin sub domain 2 [Myxococcaceae bacterium]|nr:Laminin sub domain 2 [Myxococcaceae bacterium]